MLCYLADRVYSESFQGQTGDSDSLLNSTGASADWATSGGVASTENDSWSPACVQRDVDLKLSEMNLRRCNDTRSLTNRGCECTIDCPVHANIFPIKAASYQDRFSSVAVPIWSDVEQMLENPTKKTALPTPEAELNVAPMKSESLGVDKKMHTDSKWPQPQSCSPVKDSAKRSIRSSLTTAQVAEVRSQSEDPKENPFSLRINSNSAHPGSKRRSNSESLSHKDSEGTYLVLRERVRERMRELRRSKLTYTQIEILDLLDTLLEQKGHSYCTLFTV